MLFIWLGVCVCRGVGSEGRSNGGGGSGGASSQLDMEEGKVGGMRMEKLDVVDFESGGGGVCYSSLLSFPPFFFLSLTLGRHIERGNVCCGISVDEMVV